jgi:hypothetical protein
MSTAEPATESNAFVRIDPAVRDRLRQHCQAEGLVMGRYVSNIITKALDSANDAPAPEPTRFYSRKRKLSSKRGVSRKRKARAKK